MHRQTKCLQDMKHALSDFIKYSFSLGPSLFYDQNLIILSLLKFFSKLSFSLHSKHNHTILNTPLLIYPKHTFSNNSKVLTW